MLDWDDLRFFLAVARHGSLTAAAKDLRVAQSTVGSPRWRPASRCACCTGRRTATG